MLIGATTGTVTVTLSTPAPGAHILVPETTYVVVTKGDATGLAIFGFDNVDPGDQTNCEAPVALSGVGAPGQIVTSGPALTESVVTFAATFINAVSRHPLTVSVTIT